MNKKYIFVSGGVCSSLGKGIATASLGALLEARGIRIAIIKIDPYINVDAGSMNPYQHGEVYVTEDGAETDLDLGTYARFTLSTINKHNSITTGQVYQEVIQGERSGKYLGETVQVIPHIIDCIIKRIKEVGKRDAQVILVEIGGTVGDIESIPFIEAARQMIQESPASTIAIHLTLIPQISNMELKTKPTQHSVKELREIGIQPNILMCRAPQVLSPEIKNKIALFTNVPPSHVVSAPDVNDTIYEVPINFYHQHLDSIVLDMLGISAPNIDINKWETLLSAYKSATKEVVIGMVGKYIDHSDSYKSVEESLWHGAAAHNAKLRLIGIESDRLLSEDIPTVFEGCQGIIVPGGFGKRGIEGMVHAIQYSRENNVPFFGICMGMQIMAVEFARNVLGEKEANSIEIANTKYPVTTLVEKNEKISLGGNMRLGDDDIIIEKESQLHNAYGRATITERHRHRYEILNTILPQFARHGILVSARSKHNGLAEALEWTNHAWGVGVQFHPEFISTPHTPHPLFKDFIYRALGASPI